MTWWRDSEAWWRTSDELGEFRCAVRSGAAGSTKITAPCGIVKLESPLHE
jgi:hypothetical protein